MRVTRTKAQKLLSASEYRLYESSRRGVVDDHGATRLRKLIETTRKQLEKYRSRAFSQTRAARGKGKVAVDRSSARKAAPAENTSLKAEIFSDILARFEAAHERALARPEPDRGKRRPKARKAEKKAATKKAATKRAPAKKAPTEKAKPSKAARTRAETKKAGVKARAASKSAPIAEERARKKVRAAETKQLAHGAARGRRTQAKRDSR